MTEGPEQQLSGAGQLAPHDHALRVDQVAQIGRRDADVPARVRDRTDAAGVAGHRLQHHIAQLQAAEVIAQLVEDGRPAGDRLQASPVAAAAERAVLADRGVPELARDAVAPAEQLPVQHQSRTDPVADVERYGVPLPASGAEPRLRQRCQVRGVVDEHRALHPALHDVRHLDAVPAAHDAAAADRAAGPVDRRGKRDADREDFLARRIHRLQHVGEQHRHLVELVVGAVVAGERHVVLGHDGVGDVGEGDAHVPHREVDARDQAEGVRQGDLLGAAPAADALRGVQDARDGQLFDDVRDRRRRQSRGPRELDLGQSAVLLDGVDDAGSVGFTK